MTGGPAGLAAAIAAASPGFSVTVADCRMPPLDKACGEGLLPNAVASLTRLGVALTPGHRLAGIRFVENGTVAEASFGSQPGIGLRRTALHSLLLRRACELGVSFRWGCRVDRAATACRSARGPVAERGEFSVVPLRSACKKKVGILIALQEPF